MVIDELGLTKFSPGAGNLDYVLEEVWKDGNAESMSFLFLLAVC